MNFPNMPYLCEWVRDREQARKAKELNDPYLRPQNGIINRFRFCNVHREDDYVTKWIANHMREPNYGRAWLWHWMLVARLFNLPESLDRLVGVSAYPYPEWDEWQGDLYRALDAMRTAGHNIFNAAYIVSTNGKSMDKLDYVFDEVLYPAWHHYRGSVPVTSHTKTLAHAFEGLVCLNGVGSFMAAQVIADWKHDPFWKDAPDWHSWCAPGPGSQRGLNRLMGEHPKARSWRNPHFMEVVSYVSAGILAGTGITVDGQDAQNCLCEFDKYMRAKLGEGKPKQRYRARSL